MALHDDFADMNSQSTEVPMQELADSDQWGLFGPSKKIKSSELVQHGTTIL